MEIKEQEQLEEYQLELENRIRNLLWTVSGDYSLNMKPDVRLFLRSRELALYDGIKQGAFARYYEPEEVSLYLIRKIFLGAEESALTLISQLCIEEASCLRILKERPGIASIRRKALEDVLEQDYETMPGAGDRLGRIHVAFLGDWLREEKDLPVRESWLQNSMDLIRHAGHAETTTELIQGIDRCYNAIVDPSFESRYGTLETVQAVTLEELTENGWEDYLSEEFYEEALEEMLKRISTGMTGIEKKRQEEKSGEKKARGMTVVTPEMQKKAQNYVEQNFGKSYLTEQESQKCSRLFCRGVHQGSRLHFTEGILKNPVRRNYQYEYAVRLKKKNEFWYQSHYTIVKKNISDLTMLLRKAQVAKNESQVILSDHGTIVPSRLWRIGRSSEASLFQKEIRGDSSDFVVDLLIDASGSQMERQSEVALQAYMISAALSGVHLPHRVMSYCTFWDYTVLHRMREYEDSPEADRNIFNYVASSNNRDGLAIRAAGAQLLNRDEEKKILIILSDGRPNDRILGRPNTLYAEASEKQELYTGDYAVRDTATEIRKLRTQGVRVLGVFHGEEKDLEAEQRIFGKDFAYIRDIGGFARIVGRFLVKQLEEASEL